MENNVYENGQNSYNTIGKRESVNSQLVKCAWFAPVAVILCWLAYNLLNVIVSSLAQSFNYSYETYSSGYYITLAIGSFIIFIIRILICFGLYSIAFSKVDKTIKTTTMPLLLLPFVLFLFSGALTSLIQQMFTGLIMAPVSMPLTLNAVAFIGIVVGIIGAIIAAVFSYILCSKYLEHITDKIHSESLEIHEVNTCDNSNSYNNQILQEQKSDKSRGVAALLCFFLGFLGIHRFYVGKIGTGILWLLTVGFFGIGEFIDFFVILFGGFKDSKGRKL